MKKVILISFMVMVGTAGVLAQEVIAANIGIKKVGQYKWKWNAEDSLNSKSMLFWDSPMKGFYLNSPNSTKDGKINFDGTYVPSNQSGKKNGNADGNNKKK